MALGSFAGGIGLGQFQTDVVGDEQAKATRLPVGHTAYGAKSLSNFRAKPGRRRVVSVSLAR